MSTTVTLSSDPIIAAGALRMMARHLGQTIDTDTAHYFRLIQVAGDMEQLIADAVQLSGRHHEDRELRDRATRLLDVGLRRRRMEVRKAQPRIAQPVSAEEYEAMAAAARRTGDLTQAARYAHKAASALTEAEWEAAEEAEAHAAARGWE